MQQSKFMAGFDENGKRWIKGEVSVGKGKVVLVNSQTGLGIDKIMSHLHSFVTYQASQIKLPSYSNEDVVQEIQILALEAIPKYDIEKKANMLTFLQNHIRNRVINIYKFVSEKRRRATYLGAEQIKIRCPECRAYTRVYSKVNNYTCSCCRHTTSSKDSSWKRYNLPVIELPFSLIEASMNKKAGDGPTELTEIFSDESGDLSYIRDTSIPLVDRIQKRLDFMKLYENLDNINKEIILLVIEGYTYKDIAKKVGITEKSAYAKASKFIKKKRKFK